MKEYYLIHCKSGNYKNDPTLYTEDKRVIDFINEKDGWEIKEIPDWFEKPETWNYEDTYPFNQFLEYTTEYFTEYPFIALGETEYIEIE